MIVHVRHVTTVRYPQPVELACHMLRLRPRDLPWQQVLSFAWQVAPGGHRLVEGEDHFGNKVGWLFIDGAHQAVQVAAHAVVQVVPPATPSAAATPAWEHVVRVSQVADAAHAIAEFAFGSPLAPTAPEARAWAAPSFPTGRPVLACLLELMARLHGGFRFDPAAISVSTPVTRVLQSRAGACQDLAHLMIAGLRGMGLPARFTSGYYRAGRPHAWVGCWLGPEHGWISLDPGHNLVVAGEHVWLGWGRDHADASPVHGVLPAGGPHSLEVSVDIEPRGE